MFRRILLRWTVAASVALLASCGGGGGSPGDCMLCSGGGQVADLLISLSSQSITNSGSDSLTATITAVDGNRLVLEGVTVSVAVDANAVAAVSGTTTDSAGTVTATVGAGADKSNRTVTITAKSGDVTRQASFQVTGAKVSSTYSSTVAPGSTGNTIRYFVADINNIGIGGQSITVSAPGLTSVTGTTSPSGYFDYTYDAPTAAGSLLITATVVGVTDVATIQVQETGGIPPADGTVSSASVSANPKTVPVNTAGSSANQTQIRALFVGADNKPIKNVRVRFDLNGDANNIGGTFGSGSQVLYSSADGTVTTTYIPGTRSSPTDGVTIRACWKMTDFANDTECPNSTTTTLTVTAEAISVTLGTNNQIVEGEAGLTYIKQFVVLVVDSAGNAMPGVTISPVLDLSDYLKGGYDRGATSWIWVPTAQCTNEDTNRNGIHESGEDLNNNGVLEPRKADVSIRMVGSNKTNDSGLAVLQIEYPQNVASWDRYKITVSASGVSGTEGSATYTDILPVPADDVNDTDSTPPFAVSPYGVNGSCTIAN